MKIKKEHYIQLQVLINKTRENWPAYIQDGRFSRYCWDLFWQANRENRELMTPLIDEIYMYANDNHIETALKNIIGVK